MRVPGVDRFGVETRRAIADVAAQAAERHAMQPGEGGNADRFLAQAHQRVRIFA
jgi:hypothetical protein